MCGAVPACIAGGTPACLAAGLRGGLLLGGCLVLVGVPASQEGAWPSVRVPLPRGLAFCYGLSGCGLLLCPSGLKCSLLVWSSGGQKAITEGHHTRRP